MAGKKGHRGKKKRHRGKKKGHRGQKKGQAPTETAATNATSLVPSKDGVGSLRWDEEEDEEELGHLTTWPYFPDEEMSQRVGKMFQEATKAEATAATNAEATAATNAEAEVDSICSLRCAGCFEYVPINCMKKHKCSPEKKNLDSQDVEMAPEVKTEPFEWWDEEEDQEELGHLTTWPYFPDEEMSQRVGRMFQEATKAEATAATNAEATAATNAEAEVDSICSFRCAGCFEYVPINCMRKHKCSPEKKNLAPESKRSKKD